MIEREQVGTGGRVALLRLAHGPVNALDIELCRELTEQLSAADEVGAVVLTGTGGAFSAGVDLRRLLDGGPAHVREFVPALVTLLRVAFTVPKPVVAAVNGHAIAGGGLLAAAADVAIMADGPGRIGVPEVRVGVPLPRMALEILRHRLGDVGARRVVFGAVNYLPADALVLGLVDEVVESGGVLDRAVDVAERLLADIPSDAFALTKAQLRRDGLARARAVDESDVLDIWCRRVEDGWTRRYLDEATRRPVAPR